MKKLALLLLFFIAPTLLPAQTKTQPQLAFTHVTVIDTAGGPSLPNMTVIVTGNRITAIAGTRKVKVPKGAQVVDATGKFLIPGLWDMHVHWEEKDYLPLFIANGVTGVRIMWGFPMHQQWRKEIEAGQLLGPRMLIGSPIIDGPKPIWRGSVSVADAAEARAAVIKSKQDGADFIKVYSLLPRDAYFAIADESKKIGIPYEGHVTISVSVQEASNAGQRTVEHLTGVLPACSTQQAELLKSAQETLAEIVAGKQPVWSAFHGPAYNESQKLALETYSPQKAETLFAELKKNQTWQCPTLTVLRSNAFPHDSSFTDDPRLKYMPRDVKAFWDPNAAFNKKMLKAKTPEDWALSKNVYGKNVEIVGAMQRAGVDILAGTDTLNPYCFPGFSLHDELGLLVQAGLTPMQALQAATLNPARFMGREKDLGTVERGKLADLVLLDANPLDDIGNTKRIDAVVFGGKFYSKRALDGMLAKVQALAGRKPISEALLKTIQQQNVEAAVKQYYDLKATQPEVYDFGEEQLTDAGRQLLSMKKNADAIRIFKLNVEAHSTDSAYDSLGKACIVTGDKNCAIESFRKSLELNPDNTDTTEQLKKLTAQPN